MGKPSVCAVEWVLHGRNPWASCLTEGERHAARNGDDTMAWCARQSPCVDRKRYASWVHGGPGFDFMNGYKYGPVPLLLYGPFTHVLDDGGIRLVNAFGWLALLAAVAALARQAFATVPLAPWRALIVLLAPVALPLADVLPVLTVKRGGHTYATDELGNSVITDALSADCANDVIPMLFAIAAVMLAGRRRAAWAGVCLGLSLASKQLPGALLLLLIPGLPGLARRRFFASLAGTLLLAYLPPLLTGPRELIANLVLFPLMRPTNSSSVHALVSGHVRAWLSALQVAVVAIIVVRFHRAAIRDVRTLLVSATLMTTIFVALNKVVHANYFIWIAPLAAILIAGAFTDHEAAPARRRGSS